MPQQVVVGVGAVGLSCAYFLQRAGFEVVVLDAAAAVGVPKRDIGG
jgi:glycine/D-amino acid oxidase-like deaminating enzyme